MQSLAHLQNKRRQRKTDSHENIVASNVSPESALDLSASSQLLRNDPLQKNACRKTVSGDVIALLQWLLRYLREERIFVGGGDAG